MVEKWSKMTILGVYCRESNWSGNAISDVYEGICGDLSLFCGDLLLDCVASEHRTSVKLMENDPYGRKNCQKLVDSAKMAEKWSKMTILGVYCRGQIGAELPYATDFGGVNGCGNRVFEGI